MHGGARYLLTLLQLRVPVEGLICWRNVRHLKCQTPEAQADGACSLPPSVHVRKTDFERARVELDKALLREALFEALPQVLMGCVQAAPC